jgi:hypothetical protein
MDNGSPKSRVIIKAMGTALTLAEVGEQVAWAAAALNISPFGEEIAYAEARVHRSSLDTVHGEVEFQRLHRTENPCWLPLFRGATIAKGFPIKERGNEQGLEVPLDIITPIMGARFATVLQDTAIIIGWSAMLIPVYRSGDRVQWHLVCSSNPDTQLLYQEGLARCPTRASLREVGLYDITHTRAIIG